ncbi:hypothetical protein [Methylobacterium mesophilicum]|uniref:hypothetical protein n=1 Tax=Methylobacterium mesophilicum TaxID=39956 RepID=UPI002F353857
MSAEAHGRVPVRLDPAPALLARLATATRRAAHPYPVVRGGRRACVVALCQYTAAW